MFTESEWKGDKNQYHYHCSTNYFQLSTIKPGDNIAKIILMKVYTLRQVKTFFIGFFCISCFCQEFSQENFTCVALLSRKSTCTNICCFPPKLFVVEKMYIILYCNGHGFKGDKAFFHNFCCHKPRIFYLYVWLRLFYNIIKSAFICYFKLFTSDI